MYKFCLLIFIAFIASVNISSSQLLVKFNAKAGYNKAIDYSKNTSGFTNPKLKFLGTLNQSINVGQLVIDVEFDLTSGASTAWIYFIVDADDTSKSVGVFVVKPLIGDYLAFEAPGFNVADFGLDIGENLYISDYTWIDSSVMMDDLNNYSDYKDFYDNYKPFDRVYLILFVGAMPMSGGNDEPLWAISIGNDEYTKNCAVQAVTEDVGCSIIISSVNDAAAGNIEVFPNPVTDLLTIRNINESNNYSTVNLYDMFGRLLISDGLVSGTNTLDVSGLSTGVYSIRVNNQIYKIIKE
ncbi:MAG: T9SS type A sorting domain-containing protein [Candidatus Kapabacteria bacterium]|nr:T9SS type A sorting domain-containing protein [Candidatus Kapabacteria bacterium]